MLILIVLGAVLSLAPPFLLRQILDVALPHGRIGLLTELAAGMLLATVGIRVAAVIESYLSLTVGQEIINDLRKRVYDHLQRMSLAFFTRTRTGEIQSRITNDVGGMSAAVTGVAATVVGSLATVAASLIAMVILEWRLTVLSILLLPVFALISRSVGEERRAITLERQQKLATISAFLEESLSVNGFLLTRALGSSPVLVAEFGRHSKDLADLGVRSAMAGRWRQCGVQVVMSAMPVMVYWCAGLVAHHTGTFISIGTLVAFTALQQGLFGPVAQLMQVGIAVRSSLALFQRVFEYLDLPIDIPAPEHPVPLRRARGNVRFENVHFSYGDKQVLSGIDIEVPAGGRLAIVGPTGAGKTTLGYLVPRLYDVTGGRVAIDGVDVRDLSFETLADTVGVVSQETHIFHTTVRDNLRLAKPGATSDEVEAAAKAAQIHDFIEALPDGYSTIAGERGYRFSGGERQRIAIARTLLRDPPVLVLDEATSALDAETEHAVQRALDRLSVGRTTIIIAHRLSTIRSADEIVVLDHGQIAERGDHDHLVVAGGLYASLASRSLLSPSAPADARTRRSAPHGQPTGRPSGKTAV
ncbi:ABC transporter ATP-binding protein [Actinoplanes siamensis]|uniref:ABC transporter ATP-binding protein n=1 Tax=Actinoplanes siamensis TaxID=1223317 RepID=UPI0023B274C2|nr:ABC transporter ATP-binding protein [Actinoplanes siamensis]